MKKVEIPLWANPGSLVWLEIRDKTGLEVQEYIEAVVTVADHDNQIIIVKKANSTEDEVFKPEFILERIEDHKLVDDLAAIPTLNDAELMKHLEVRYKQDYIHCFCGPTLVVINPYKKVEREESQETWDLIHHHLKENTLAECPPHLWTISAKCWDGLFKTGLNQAICISGESGAGKTESTKRCMTFLTKMNSSRQSTLAVPIEDKILACNPLLEAFGNAKTFRNDNSSRFGKYTVLYIDTDKKKVRGASIENYLLEKSRCVVLGKEERNYHIFYCLCRFGTQEMLEKYKMINNNGKCDMSKFNFLNGSGVYTVAKINDQEFMDDVQQSLQNLDFSEKEQDGIWRNIATILWLGNVEVDSSEFVEGQKPCMIKRNEPWKNVIELLGIDQNLFEMALTHKEIKVGASVTRSPLSPSQCKNSIDSIAKEIYNKMFSWIVLKLNQTLIPKGDLKSFGTIGILDIFGFEIFDKNSLEQFFINFANERLQSLYIEYIFKNECKIFEEEGLAEYTQLIVYTDNKPIVNTLEYQRLPPGIFNLIDGACSMNKTDDKLHADIKTQHQNSRIITFPKFAKEMSFTIKHTAREVEYLTDNFVEKNKDELSPFLKQAFDTSDETIVAIFKMQSGLKKIQEDDPTQRVNPNEKFLGFKFRRDMSNLIDQLIICQCQFIRCIKPNEVKQKDFWNAQLALLQIQYMGMLDSLKVRKQSYPNRFTFAQFFEVYQDLDMGENGAKNFRSLQSQGVKFKDLAKGIFNYIEQKPTDKDVLYGSGRIFLQEDYKIKLDKMLLAKQKKKREALKQISNLFIQYQKKKGINEFFVGQSKSIQFSRDLLKSWTAKLDGLKYKTYIRIVKRLQYKFRFVREKRLKNQQAHNMQLILRYLSMYKFSQVIKYILYFKRKVHLMHAMLDVKIRNSKNRHCRAIVDDLIKESWDQITKEISTNSAKVLQRTFRSYQLREQKAELCKGLVAKMQEIQESNSSSAIQKHIRGYLVRQEMERLNRAAAKIQGYMRMKWMREYFLKMLAALAVLQRWFKKMYIRQVKINEKLVPFMEENQSYLQSVAKLEDRILFGSDQEIKELQSGQDYQKMPFGQSEVPSSFGSDNFKKFIPTPPEIEVQTKVKFISLLVDLDVAGDSTHSYGGTWAKGFVEFIEDVHKRGKRFLQLEVGDSFTMGITEEKEVYSWGLNDHNQCAKNSQSFTCPLSMVKNLSANNVRQLSVGKDHGLMVDEAGNIFQWGDNSQGQLGVGHKKKVNSIVILDDLKEEIKYAHAKENKNYLLTNKGELYEWPVKRGEEVLLIPTKMRLDKVEISSISPGNDFLMMLTNNGFLYSKGNNFYGQLGLSDYNPREEPERLEFFVNANERVLEVSAGHKHVICRTVLKRIFTWGMNNNGQLGHGDFIAKPLPEEITISNQKGIRFPPRSVQAGLNSCFILINDKNCYFTGKIGSKQKVASTAQKFSFEKKFHANRVSDNFGSVKIVTKWSSMMSATYMIFADFRKTQMSSFNREKYIDQINAEWTACKDQLLPSSSAILNKYMDSKYLQHPPTKKSTQIVLKHIQEYQLPPQPFDFEAKPQFDSLQVTQEIPSEKDLMIEEPSKENKKVVSKTQKIGQKTQKIEQPKQNGNKDTKPAQKTPVVKATPKAPVQKPAEKVSQLTAEQKKIFEKLKKKDATKLTAQEKKIFMMLSSIN